MCISLSLENEKLINAEYVIEDVFIPDDMSTSKLLNTELIK